MLLWALCGMVALLCWCWVRLRWLAVRGYWARRGVPHEPPHPLLGSLTFLMRENPAIWFRRMYSRFPGAQCVGIWSLWRPGLLVHSPDLARRVLVTDFHCFTDRYIGCDHDPNGRHALFSTNNPFWSLIRKKMTGAFTSAKLKSMHDIITSKTKDLVERVKDEIDEGNSTIDLWRLFADFNTDVISEALLGVRSEAARRGASPLRRVTSQFNQASLYKTLAWNCLFFLPPVSKLLRLPFLPREALVPLRHMFDAVVAQRSGGGGGAGRRGPPADLMDFIMSIERGAHTSETHADIMFAQTSALLQAGYDTTTLTLSFMLYELAFSCEAQEKLHQELVEAKEMINNQEFDSTLLSELPYLNCCIKETLRKYPIMSWLDRVTTRQCQVEGATLPAGTPVYVNVAGLHHDPALFPEPERFRPERFLPHAEPALQPYSYLPFGEGPRQCIGKRFALQTLRWSLAALALRYAVRPAPAAPPPARCPLHSSGVLIMPGIPLLLQFLHRQ